jgi:hypothetical protein
MSKPVASNLPPALVQAYRETYYQVNAGPADLPPCVLRVDEVSNSLAALHKNLGVDCSAFVTACNPWSENLVDKENVKRMDKLRQLLRTRSLRWLEGVGQHPGNLWPGEPSVLVWGLSLAAAKVLAQDFEQNTFVWSGADARPQLVLLR